MTTSLERTDAGKSTTAGGTYPQRQELAALGQRGLPIGPVLSITGGVRSEDVQAQKEKNQKEIPTQPIKKPNS